MVVVLSYEGREDTLACLESLERQTWPALTTVVVDNGSKDGSPDAVREHHPRAVLIETGENLGFAEGNNVGMRHAIELGADYVLLLNNDALAAPDAVSTLVETAREKPAAGALCPLIVFADPEDKVWYAGARYDARLPYNGRQEGYGQPATVIATEPYPTGRLSGAAVLVPVRVLERVGLLAADLFLHMEDVEWSLRMRAAGFGLWVVPAARVVHRVSIASGGEHSTTIAYFALRNTLAVGDRHGPGGARGRLRRAAILMVHVAHARRAERRLENLRALFEGWRDYRAGRMGPRGARR